MATIFGRVAIQYTDRWDITRNVEAINHAIEKAFPNMFEIDFSPAEDGPDKLEVTVFMNGEEEGELVHSMENGDGYITKQNLESFIDKVMALI